MAIYEYDCPKCGTFEVTQKMTDEALTTHAECGSPVQRRISLTSFSLKGGGWANDGYRSAGSAKTMDAGGCGSGQCGTGACGLN
jgi:putative FmdB family regulatory protein